MEVARDYAPCLQRGGYDILQNVVAQSHPGGEVCPKSRKGRGKDGDCIGGDCVVCPSGSLTPLRPPRRFCYTTFISPAGWTSVHCFGGHFFDMEMETTEYPPYPNRPMTDSDLVNLILARGLDADAGELSSAVASVGYYRLKG